MPARWLIHVACCGPWELTTHFAVGYLRRKILPEMKSNPLSVLTVDIAVVDGCEVADTTAAPNGGLQSTL